MRQGISFLVVAIVVCGNMVMLTGCGGSGKSGSTSRTAPSVVTRASVQTLHQATMRGTGQSGYQTTSMAAIRNSATPRMTASPVNGVPTPVPNMPMIGAFIRNMAAVPPVVQSVYVNSVTRKTRSEPGGGSGSSPGDPGTGTFEPFPTFYFDYYLGLWVQISDEPGKFTYSLFEDEAKTRPAGSIETIQPTDFQTYPQVYRSTYSFSAGTLKGAYGSYENTLSADYSGKSVYSNHYADGSVDSGESVWSGQGDYAWKFRCDFAGGGWNQGEGTWKSDGSGQSKTSSSDGYGADYVFNADGSGRGTIRGNEPGLPATIVWDTQGNTTITYADGTVERFPGWRDGGVIVQPAQVDTVSSNR